MAIAKERLQYEDFLEVIHPHTTLIQTRLTLEF